PEARERGDGRDDQQVLAPGDGEPEKSKEEQDQRAGPRGEDVETEHRFPKQRREDEHRGEAVERGFHAALRRGAGSPEQPYDGIQDADDDARGDGDAIGFREGAEEVSAGEG